MRKTVREIFRIDSKTPPRPENNIKPNKPERLGDFPPWEILDSMSGYQINKEEIIFYQNELERKHPGERSVVTKGHLRDRDLNVAVKMFEYEEDSDREPLTSSFVHELSLLRNLNDENIVKAAGFVASYKEKIAWTVFPWQENGNLKEFVSSKDWRLSERVSLLYDVASGLEYLHGQKPPICHGNLTPLNILVNGSNNAVITGFCSARVLDTPEVDPGHLKKQQAPLQASVDDALRVDFYYTGIISLTGPLSSMGSVAPELVSGSQSSLASDTWAFGWALAGQMSLVDTETDGTIVTDTFECVMFASEGSEVYGVIEGKFANPKKKFLNLLRTSNLGLCQLMSKCWSPEPAKRYNAAECRKDISFMPMKLPRANQSIDNGSERSSPLVGAITELHRRLRKFALVQESETYQFGRDPEAVSKCLEHGRQFLRDEDFPRAERIFLAAGVCYAGLGLRFGCADAIHELGELFGVQEMLDDAELCFTTAKWIGSLIRDNQRTVRSTLRLGAVSRRQGKLSKAEKLLAEALQKYTKERDNYGRSDTLYELGSIYLQQDRCVEAEKHFGVALQICALIGDNQCADVLQKLGNHYLEQRQYSKAEELSTRALSVWISLSRDSERALTHRQLGDLYRDWSRYAEAEDHYTQASTIYKEKGALDRAIMLDRLGGLYLKQGRYKEAEEQYNGALELGPSVREGFDQSRVGALQKLGELCRTQARYSEARDHLTNAIGILTSEEARPSRAGMLRELADLDQMQGRSSEAADRLIEALSIDTSLKDESNRAKTLHRLGDLYWKQGRHFKAEGYFTEARAAYASLGDSFSRAEVLCQLANLYQVQDCHPEAEKHFAEAMALLTSVGAKSDNAKMLLKVGQLLQQRNQFSEAEEVFTEALRVSAPASDDLSRANSLRKLGELYQRQARYSRAEESFTMALQIYTSLGDHLSQKRTESSLADVRRWQCRFADAEVAFRAVEAFYIQIGHPLGNAYTKCRLGDTYRQQGKHGEAFKLYHEAQNLFEKCNCIPGLADAVVGLGHVLRFQGRYSRARSCFLEARNVYGSIENKIGFAEATCGMGDLYRFQGKYSKADESYSEARSTYQRFGSENHPCGLAGTICGLGSIHCSQGRHSEAQSCFDEAKSLYDRVGNKLGVAETFCRMGDFHRSQGDYVNAEESYTEAQTIYRQLDHSLGVGEVTCGLGYLRRMECRNAEAESLFNEAQKLCSEGEHGFGAANAALGLATVHFARMEYDTAASDAKKALDFYTQADILPSKARTLLILAQIRGLEHRDDESRAYIDEAAAVFSDIGDENGVSLCHEHRLHLVEETPTLTSTEEQPVPTVRAPTSNRH